MPTVNQKICRQATIARKEFVPNIIMMSLNANMGLA